MEVPRESAPSKSRFSATTSETAFTSANATARCSAQPEVMEETPAPGIPRRLIDRLGKRCVEACKKIGHRGTGTFEFLYENGQFAAYRNEHPSAG